MFGRVLLPKLSFRGADRRHRRRTRTRNPDMGVSDRAKHVGIPRHANWSG